MQIDAGSRTDSGRVRKNNEDCFATLPEIGLYVISDGMGGEAYGELASRLAVESIVARAKAEPGSHDEHGLQLLAAVREANSAIREAAAGREDRSGMGATLVAAWLGGDSAWLAHVGDSRAYRYRGGELVQITADHSLVAEQVRRGVITAEQAERSRLQNVLLRALGGTDNIEADAAEWKLETGDTLLLCTDGLTRMIPDETIRATLAEVPCAQDAANRLVDLANEAGGADNITVIVLRIAG